MENPELADFLRSRRARLAPTTVQVGRRVPGLRREEVAQLAGVSVDYYKKLERGRTGAASSSVLNAVARALQLDEVERAHLFTLAEPRAATPAVPQVARPGLVAVMNQLATPALIMGRGRVVLAMNAAATVLYGDLVGASMVRFVFSPAGRALYAEWESSARTTVAALRDEAARHPGDASIGALVADLCGSDEDFRRWWGDHDVYRRTAGVKRFRHPTLGEITMSYEAMTPVGDDEQVLGVHQPV